MDETKKTIYELLVTQNGNGFVYMKDYVSKTAAERRGHRLVDRFTTEAHEAGFNHLNYQFRVREYQVPR